MNFTCEMTIRAPRDSVFNALRDARFFASCIDGVGDMKQIDEGRYDAVLETKVRYEINAALTGNSAASGSRC